MRNRLRLAELTLTAALSACNLAAPLPTPPTVAPPIVTQTQPSAVSLPETPLPASPTPKPDFVTISPKDAPVNCRIGPGTVYSLVNELKEEQSTQVTGTNPDGTWYYVKDPGNPHGFCWVSSNFVEVTGSVDSLPVITPPPASVTNIDLTVEPLLINVSCSALPQVVYFTAKVTADAPTIVTYRWEVSNGISSVPNAIAFEEAETQTISDYYQIASPDDYSIRLHVLSPNDISQDASFRVLCNP